MCWKVNRNKTKQSKAKKKNKEKSDHNSLRKNSFKLQLHVIALCKFNLK